MVENGKKTGFSNQVQKIIYEVMGDYLPHTLEEVRKKCRESGVEIKEKSKALNTVVYRMKKDGKIRRKKQRKIQNGKGPVFCGRMKKHMVN